MDNRKRSQRLTRIFWVYLASVCLESSNFTFTSHSQRVLFGFWFLMIVVLMNTFVGYMESALMLKEETDRVDAIEDLVQQPDMQPMVFEAAGFLQVIEVRKLPRLPKFCKHFLVQIFKFRKQNFNGSVSFYT